MEEQVAKDSSEALVAVEGGSSGLAVATVAAVGNIRQMALAAAATEGCTLHQVPVEAVAVARICRVGLVATVAVVAREEDLARVVTVRLVRVLHQCR